MTIKLLLLTLLAVGLSGCPTPQPPTAAVCPSKTNCGQCTSVPVCGWCASTDYAARGCTALRAPCLGTPVTVTEDCPEDATGGLR
jgi:hypothetical protein